MSEHELECPQNTSVSYHNCGYCQIIGDAYQRGREDAAKAVGALYNILSWDDIVRTARGDRE